MPSHRQRATPTLLLFFLLCCGPALGAGILDEILPQVEGTAWGLPHANARAAMGPDVVYETPEVLVVPWRLGSAVATANFLFNKSGQLYNLAWYATIPVSDMKTAQALEKELVDALRKRYGRPAHTFSDGDARKAAKAAREAPRLAAEREKLLKEMQAKKARGKQSEKEALADAGRIFQMMPTIFYSKLAFFDGGAVWAYTNLLCSTDGTCYLHLQFVSKDLTRGEDYRPMTEKLFSYSPLDRDQDLVTKSNRTIEARQRGQAGR